MHPDRALEVLAATFDAELEESWPRHPIPLPAGAELPGELLFADHLFVSAPRGKRVIRWLAPPLMYRDEDLEEWAKVEAAETRLAQGLPAGIEDPEVVGRLAAEVQASARGRTRGKKLKSSTPPRSARGRISRLDVPLFAPEPDGSADRAWRGADPDPR